MTSTTIQAAVCFEHGTPLVLGQVHLRGPAEGEVEVTLEAVAICHSDISYMEGAWGGELPAVYGHEAAGRITGLGAGVTAYAMGARVLVTLIRSCGQCGSCAGGHPVNCDGNQPAAPALALPDGRSVTKAMNCGAFAEKVVVDQSQIALIGEEMGADVACLLACGVPTGVGAAVNTAQVRPGQTVVVIGAGGVGLNAIQGARISGAARIVALDMEPSKLEDAKSFGATHGILASLPDPAQALREITGGGLADHVFVTVGAIPAYDVAQNLLGARGTLYAVGMPHSGQISSYEPVNIAFMGQGIRGSMLGDIVLARDVPWMVELYRQGRLKLDELISARWRFDQINEAIADTKAGKARRNVIVF